MPAKRLGSGKAAATLAAICAARLGIPLDPNEELNHGRQSSLIGAPAFGILCIRPIKRLLAAKLMR
jgi:hypothetical protein